MQYKAEISKYQKKDAITAICFWIVLMVLYAVSGLVGSLFGIPLITVTTTVSPIACVTIVLIKRQGLSSLGFRRENFLPSLGAGFLFGIAYIVVGAVIPAIIYGWKLMPLGNILFQLLYYFVFIALGEEIIFRGYIQTRLYGLFKNDIIAVLMGALFFALMHAPFQLASGNRVFDPLFVVWLAFVFICHFMYNSFFRKYKVIWGPILLHTFWNLRSDIFVIVNSPWWYDYLPLTTTVLVSVALGIRALYLHRRT